MNFRQTRVKPSDISRILESLKRGHACTYRMGIISFAFPIRARVVKWQTRMFEGHVPKGVGVQVPPRAPISFCDPL